MRPGPDTPAVISGGASGLGAATARALARRGARVTILDLDATRGTQVAGEVHGLYCETDVTDPAAVLPRSSGRRTRTGRPASPSPAPGSPRPAVPSTARGGRTIRGSSAVFWR